MTDQTTTVTVPFTIRKRGGRKLILTPDGTPASLPTRARPDSALLKALSSLARVGGEAGSPSGVRISFRPPRLRIVNGTVMVVV